MKKKLDFDDNYKHQKKFRYQKTDQRVLTKTSGKLPDNAEQGIVTLVIGNMFWVQPVDENNKLIDELLECNKSGTLITANIQSTLIAVGDEVHFIRDKHKARSKTEYSQGTIVKIEERKTYLSRLANFKKDEQIIAANVDNLLVMASTAEPYYNKRLIDRYLVAAEYGFLKPAICINKTDLIPAKEVKDDLEIYKKLGIEVFYISAEKNKGIKKLTDFLKDKSTVFSGPSGVGKSTLLNLLLGEERQIVREVSDKTSKGKHTTSYVQMFTLPFGGVVVDSPGLREFQLFAMPKEELIHYFHDFDEYSDNCKFTACTHTHEPDCGVKQAVENEKIDTERYESYLNIFYSLEEAEKEG